MSYENLYTTESMPYTESYENLYTWETMFYPVSLTKNNFLSFLDSLVSELSLNSFLFDLSKIIAFDFIDSKNQSGNYIHRDYMSFNEPSDKIYSKELAYTCVLISLKLCTDTTYNTHSFCVFCENMYIAKLEWDIFINFNFSFNEQIKKAITINNNFLLYYEHQYETFPIYYDNCYLWNNIVSSVYIQSYQL